MTNLQNLEQYQIVELIKDRIEYIADFKGISATSLTRLTGFTHEVTIHEVIKTATQFTSEKKLNKFSNEQYVVAYETLGTIVEEMEA